MSNQENKGYCVNSLLAKVLKEYVQEPDWSALKTEIEAHKYANIKMPDFLEHWYAILHVTGDSVVIQDVLLKVGHTRFEVHVVRLADWHNVFREWIGKEHPRFSDCDSEFERGMLAYGADVSDVFW